MKSQPRTRTPGPRDSTSARLARAAVTATTMAAGAVALLAMSPRASADPTDVSSAVDALLLTQQQIETADTALPFVTSADQALVGTYEQDAATGILSFLLSEQNGSATLAYQSTAPLADIQEGVGFDNPDDLYTSIPLSSNETITLTVTPGPGTEDLSFGPYAGYDAANVTNPTALQDAVDLSSMTPNANGSYTIVLSPTEQSGNWVDTAGADEVTIRNALGEWGLTPDQISIQTSDATSASSIPELSSSDVTSLLNTIDDSLASNNTQATEIMEDIGKLPDNYVSPIQETSSVGSGGLPGQLSAFGHFDLSSGQALILEVPNVDSTYSGAEIADVWSQTNPFETVEGSLNNTQAFADPDGYTYYVISATNPGVANWLNTDGLSDGDVALRWQGVEGTFTPEAITTEVVPVDEVSQYLPADTPTVTAAQYATDVQNRLLDYNYDLDETKNSTWVADNLELDQIKEAMGTAQYDEVFGSQQDVPTVLERMTDSSLMPNWDTVANDVLTNPAGSLTAIEGNLSLAEKDIELPAQLAVARVEEVLDQTAQTVQSDITSDQFSQALSALETGAQGLGTVVDETLTDPSTSITAGILNAQDDLAVAIMNATGTASSSGASSAVGSLSSTLLADLSSVLNPADSAAALDLSGLASATADVAPNLSEWLSTLF